MREVIAFRRARREHYCTLMLPNLWTGSPSHGAFVARELGLPAVVNTHDATRRLRSGDRVRVDGSAGTITRIP
nr:MULTISPECIES: PEP-utilizing enzyme [Mycobacterium]